MVTTRKEELCPRALRLPGQVCSLLGAYFKASLLGGGGREDPPSRHSIWLPFRAATGLGRERPRRWKATGLAAAHPMLSQTLWFSLLGFFFSSVV